MTFRFILSTLLVTLMMTSCVKRDNTSAAPAPAQKAAANKASTAAPASRKRNKIYNSDWKLALVNMVNDQKLTIDDKSVTVSKSSKNRISGWAIDRNQTSAPKEVFVKINGIMYKTRTGLKSSYLADYYKKSSLSNAGFTINLPANTFKAGRNDMEVVITNSNDAKFSSTQKLTVIAN